MFHIVELEFEPDEDGESPCQTVFLGTTRAKAVEFLAERAHYSMSDRNWLWFVYAVEPDDPKMIPHDRQLFGRDGVAYATRREAWAQQADLESTRRYSL